MRSCLRPERAAAARPGYPPPEYRLPDSAKAQPSTRGRLTACSRPTPLAAFADRAAPVPHGPDFPPHASGPVCIPGIRRPGGRFTAHDDERSRGGLVSLRQKAAGVVAVRPKSPLCFLQVPLAHRAQSAARLSRTTSR
jgi:hypothetical protein